MREILFTKHLQSGFTTELVTVWEFANCNVCFGYRCVSCVVLLTDPAAGNSRSMVQPLIVFLKLGFSAAELMVLADE